MTSARRRRVLRALACGVAIALLGVLLNEPLADAEQRFGLQWLFGVRGPMPAPPAVAVLTLDEDSLATLCGGDRPRACPRSLYAELVEHLKAAGARVIVFDMTFTTVDTAAHDAAFARAVERAGNVIMAEPVYVDARPVHDARGQVLAQMTTKQIVPTIAPLDGAAAGRAPLLLPKAARVDSYLAFLDGQPSLPVLAFHLHAWTAFDTFLQAHTHRRATPAGAGARAQAQWLASAAGQDALDAAHAGAAPVSATAEDRLTRAFRHLYHGDDERHLNHYGPAGSIRTLSLLSFLAAARAATPTIDTPALQAVRDRTVFIGYSPATSTGRDKVRDDYRTVYSRANGQDTSGVEIAATAFANLWLDEPLRPIDTRARLAGIAVWGLLIGALCRWLRPSRATAAAVLLAALYLGAVYAAFRGGAWWLPSVVPIGVQLPLALFAGVALNYVDTRRERERIQQALGYFLPNKLVQQLSRRDGPPAPASEVTFGACLATDIEQYTRVAEHMAPGRLGPLMNAYYEQLIVPVEQTEGIVVDVVGDSMVAVWVEAPTAARIRHNACRAALDIVHALERFNAPSADRPPLPTRLGLHAGELLLGSMGASGHYEYRAVGDIVNTASRLQSLNKTLGTRLLASATMVDGLDDLALRPLGAFVMAGKTEAIEVVEILGWTHELAATTRERCERFAAALADYRSGRVADALAGLDALLIDHPGDGPARFYRAHCERHPPATAIAIDLK